MIDVQVNQRQLQDLIQKTDPAMIKAPLADLMEEAGALGKAVARHNLAGGTEQAKISMRADVEPITALVYSVMPEARAMSIEVGRQPGDAPTLLQAYRWWTGSRYATQRRMADISKSDRKHTVLVQEAIRQRGTRGKAFIKGAANALRKELPRMLDKLAQKIESGFKR